MINNCPKCGNPLQDGTVSCPICGTNITSELTVTPLTVGIQPVQPVAVQPVAPVVEVQPQVAVVQTPVAVQPVPVVQTSVAQTQPVTAQPVVAQPAVAQPVAQIQPVAVAQPVEQQIVAPVSVTPVVEVQPQVAVVQAPVAPAPVAVELAPASQETPVVTTPTPIAPVVAPTPAAVQPQEQIPVVAPTENVVPATQTIATGEISADPTIAPQIASLTPITPTINAAATLETLTGQTQIKTDSEEKTETKEEAKEENKKKKMSFNLKNLTKNQKIIAIAVIAVIVMCVVGIALSSSSLGKPVNVVQNNTPTEEVAIAKEVTSNGYKLKLEEGWIVEENGTNVLLKKEDDSVVISVQHTAMSLDDLTAEYFEDYFTSQTSFSDVKVENTTISGKNAYIINTSYSVGESEEKNPVQFYYINGGSNLIIGSVIFYEDEDSKTNNAAFITNLMGTMSYSDDTVKALETIGMYSNIFNEYNNALKKETNVESPVVVDPNQNQEVTTPDIPIIIN